MSVNSINPAEIFGGTWEQIKGRFLLGVGANEENNSWAFGSINAGVVNCPVKEKGGEAQHQLTVNEMPTNIGKLNALSWASNNGQTTGAFSVVQQHKDRTSGGGSDWGDALYTLSGGGKVHNNMPPYFAVYIWYRTS